MFSFEDLNLEGGEELNVETTPPIEEEVEKKVETDTTDTTDTSSVEVPENLDTTTINEEGDNDALASMVNYLKEQGVLYMEEDKEVKITSLEDFKDLIKSSNEKARYANLTESQQRYQDALENGVPMKDYEKVEKEIQAFSNIKPENLEEEQTRYQVIALDLMESGVEREKALKLAEYALQDEAGSKVEAKKALDNLIQVKTEKYKTLLESSKAQQITEINDIEKAINDKTELMGMSLNDVSKKKLFDQMTMKVGYTDSGTPLNKFQAWQKENPIEASVMLNYFFMITDGGKDFSQFTKQATSKSTKELESKLRQLSFDKDGSVIINEGNSGKSNSSGEGTLTINI